MPDDPDDPASPVRILPLLRQGEHARFVRLLARLKLTPEAWVEKKIRDAIRDLMD